jgi:hypothetical protein
MVTKGLCQALASGPLALIRGNSKNHDRRIEPTPERMVNWEPMSASLRRAS